MSDSNENNTGWKLHGYKAPRQWTEEEIKEAANYIKNERPEIWQELLEQEEATGDLRELDAADIAYALLRKQFKGVDSRDIDELFMLIRRILREEFSHKNNQ